jgi:hypothetical protein
VRILAVTIVGVFLGTVAASCSNDGNQSPPGGSAGATGGAATSAGSTAGSTGGVPGSGGQAGSMTGGSAGSTGSTSTGTTGGGAGTNGAGGSTGGKGGDAGAGGSQRDSGTAGSGGTTGADSSTCTNTQTDPNNCGHCGKVCRGLDSTCTATSCCKSGSCAPFMGQCIQQSDGFTTCTAYCQSIGESCVPTACLAGRTWAGWSSGFKDRCDTLGPNGESGSGACDEVLPWNTGTSYWVRCCCSDTRP